MFSRTTIESSTKIPTTKDIAIRVIKFNEKPIKYIKINVGIIEDGKATITKSELLKLCRKNNITRPTITTAIARSCITPSAEAIVYSL